jgi:hypothetical protein
MGEKHNEPFQLPFNSSLRVDNQGWEGVFGNQAEKRRSMVSLSFEGPELTISGATGAVHEKNALNGSNSQIGVYCSSPGGQS